MSRPALPILAAVLAAPLALAACASAPKPVVAQATPAAAPPRPTPPAGAYATVLLPPRGPDGGYLTPNRDLGPQRTIWNVRAAFNVAALRCTGDEGRAITANYNLLLKAQKPLLTKAYSDIRGYYRKSDPAQGDTRFDRDQTILYNYFSQAGGKAAFCATAARLAEQSTAIAPAGFAAFASIALPALDAPFTAFYEAYARYEIALAAWERSYGAHPAATPATETALLN